MLNKTPESVKPNNKKEEKKRRSIFSYETKPIAIAGRECLVLCNQIAANMSKMYKYQLGQEIKCDVFASGDLVDVTANTHGHGFTGAIQRWNNARGRMSHGGGPVHRAQGSIGGRTFPGRVWKNKHMAGQYGNEQVTVKNLQVVKVDVAKNCLMIRGSIPGPSGRIVTVQEAKSAMRGNK